MENLCLHITVLSLMLFAGIELNRFSRFLKMPILICFLGLGILCGPHGLDIFCEFDMKTVHAFGEIAVCFIIFSSGLQTSFQSIRKVLVTGTILAAAGVFLTAVLSAFFLFRISRMSLFTAEDFPTALMIAAATASTDAAAIFAILRERKARLRPELQGLIEYESGSNDPAALLLTSIMIQFAVLHKPAGFLSVSWTIGTGILWGLGAGAVIGFLVGLFGQWFYNRIQSFLQYNGLRLVAAIAIVLFCFGISHLFFEANSLMVCYAAGITMGNIRFSFKHTFIKFNDGISSLMQIVLFTLLGAFFDYHMLFSLRNMAGAVSCALFLMFIARPAAVMICMIGSPFSIRERIFTSWAGLRGSAPIMLAAMVAAAEPSRFFRLGENIFHGVFTLVLLSILFQGSTLMWLAKKLGLLLPYKEPDEDILECDERPDGSELWKFTLSEKDCYIGKTLAECRSLTVRHMIDAGFPDTPVMLMIRRKGKIIPQESNVVLQTGDELSMFGKQEGLYHMQQNFIPGSECASSRTFSQILRKIMKKNCPRPEN